MRRIVETTEGGLEDRLGEPILILCHAYFYTGTLTGVNDDHVELTDAKIVYSTGAWSEPGWVDAQSLPGKAWCVRKDAIESWGDVK